MGSSAKHYQQASNEFHGSIQGGDCGVLFAGNANNHGGIMNIRSPLSRDSQATNSAGRYETYMKSTEERLRECRTALHLGWTDPYEDRAKIISVKTKRGRIITAHCEWVISHPMYKAWENTRTPSQLLWITSLEERGKTMMAIHLSKELEKLARTSTTTTVLYFFIERQDKRGTAVDVLMGLIRRFTEVHAELIKHLFEVYDLQKDQLFGANGIEALWRIFMKMVSDTIAGQVYCIIDGLDYCSDDSLRRLVGLITNFFLDESQTVVDENTNAGLYSQGPSGSYASPCNQASRYPHGAPPGYPQTSQASPYPESPYPQRTPSGPSCAQRRSGPKRGAGLKMILVSREKPEWMVDQLSEFPRIDIGVRGRKNGAISGSAAPKPERRAPTLADVATTVIRRQTQDKGNSNASAVSQILPTHTQVSTANPLPPLDPGSSSHAISQLPYAISSIQTPSVQSPISTANTLLSPRPNGSSTGQLSNPQTQNSIIPSSPPTLQNNMSTAPSTRPISPPATPVPASRPSPPTTQPYQQGAPPAQPQVFELDPSPATPAPASRPSPPTTQPYKQGAPPAQPQVFELDPSPATKYSSAYLSLPEALVLDESQYMEEPPQYAQGEAGTAYGDDKKDENGTVGVDMDFEDPALRLYIEAKLEELAVERQYPTEVQSYIIAALEHRGDDTFLWVDFAIEEIRKVELAHIEAVLNSIPPTLTEMYIYILLNIPPGLVDLVAGLLRWTVCAKRPLDLSELTFVLNLSHYHANDATNYLLNAIYACGNMLTVSSQDGTVNIVHGSLVDFLSGASSPILADPRLSRFVIRPTQADSDIANFCISYLEAGCCKEGPICLAKNEVHYNQRVAQFPFMPYAASFWAEHLRNAVVSYLNLSSPFFQPKSAIRKNWWQTYWAFSTGKGTGLAPKNFTLLHLAAYLDLVPLAQHMMQKGDLPSRLDKRDSHGYSPIDYAVIRGHLAMFQYLIRAGASQKGNGESLLELACRKGQRDIVSLLIDTGYNVNMRAKGITVKETMYFMTKWLPGIISEGLEYDRDTWSLMFRDVGIEELTPLGQAAIFGHSAVIELLINRGAIVDAGTTKGFTPLHTASYTGQMECVQLLIDRGATIMVRTVDQWLPLHFAALRGKLAVVEFFLNRGVPIESITVKLKSALHFAAYAGHADVVRLLIERGANVELKSHKGETPLHLATRHLKPQVIELLLSFGANRAAVTNEGKTALDLVQTSTTILGQECKRILQTFGSQGYTPWTPPQGPGTATAAGTTTAAGTETASASSPSAEARQGPMGPVSVQRFTPAQAPKAWPIQGFQANVSLHREFLPAQPTPGTQTMQQPMNTGNPSNPQSSFHQTQSQPVQGQSKFTYDAQATLQQQFTESQYATPFDSPSGPPPAYTSPAAGSNVYGSSNRPEKSPSATMSATTSSANVRQTPDAQSAIPAHQRSMDSLQNNAAAPVPVSQQPIGQLGTIQMMNAMSISNTASTSAQPPAVPNRSLTQPSFKPPFAHPQSYPSPNPPNRSASMTSAYYPSPVPTIQTPASPLIVPPQPATAPPISPYQPPSSPVSPMQSYQQPHQNSTQVPPTQYARSHSLNANPHTPSPTSQFLNPTPTTPYTGQEPQPQPTQSPQFTGNTTASTYNASFEYSAPAVVAPCNPNIGQIPIGVPANGGGNWQQQGQGQQTNNQGCQGMGNRMLFAPPPTTPVVQKKKGFLGGLRGG